MRTNRKTMAGLAAAALIGGLVAGCGQSTQTPASHPPATTAPKAPATQAPKETAPAPKETAPKAPATQAPKLTTGQEQAVQAARGYLDLGTGFSYRGLLDQLTAKTGNGFAKADAEFAVRYLHPDWNAQAVAAAKGYLDTGMGFSRASMIQQLTSPYGNQFTQAQAVYAADKVGL